MRTVVVTLAAAIATLSPWCAYPQAAAGPQMRLVVPAPAGSAPDVIARVLGDQMRVRLNRTVVIDNKPGAGGILSVQSVKGAAPDGNTLLLAQAAVATVTPLTYRAATYDMERDFESVSVVASTPMLFVANAASGPKSLADAIAAAKSSPDRLTIGSPARGSIPHLSGELLDQSTGARFNNVPMSNSGQAIQAVVNGDSQLSVDGAAPLLPLVKSGRLRALAVTAEKQLPGLEGIPLARDVVPNLNVSGWFMLFAPKGTPKATLERLNAAVDTALKSPEVVAKLQELANYSVGGSLADARGFLGREKKLWADVIKRAGIERE